MSKDNLPASPPEGKPSLMQRFGDYMQDPLGSIVTATAATIGSFGFVLSGIWFVNLAVN